MKRRKVEPNPSVKLTHNGGARLLAPSRSAAPLRAAYLQRYAPLMPLAVCYLLFAALIAGRVGVAVAADPEVRPQVEQTSKLVIRRGTSSASVHIADAERIRRVVDELNRLRKIVWHPWVGKHGTCSMNVAFLRGEHRALTLYVYANKVFEVPPGRQLPHFEVAAGTKELPELHGLLPEVGHPERCRW
jgi:hypothetical protein